MGSSRISTALLGRIGIPRQRRRQAPISSGAEMLGSSSFGSSRRPRTRLVAGKSCRLRGALTPVGSTPTPQPGLRVVTDMSVGVGNRRSGEGSEARQQLRWKALPAAGWPVLRVPGRRPATTRATRGAWPGSAQQAHAHRPPRAGRSPLRTSWGGRPTQMRPAAGRGAVLGLCIGHRGLNACCWRAPPPQRRQTMKSS